MADLNHFKTQFSNLREIAHLNNAGQAPISAPARETLIEWAERMYEQGAFSFDPMLYAAERARTSLARLLGSDSNEVAFFQGASSAISQVARGIPLNSEDEILLWDQEYPSNVYPWSEAAKIAGAKIIRVNSRDNLATPVNLLMERVTPKTKVIAVSWVQYRTGAITNLKKLTEFASARGIFTCADIIQGAGILPFHFHDSGLDAACGGSHKWLCAPHGAGFMLLRKEHQTRISPLLVGAMSFGMPETPVDLQMPTKPGPARYEPGGRAFAEIAALGASCDLILSVGIETLQKESIRLGKKFIRGLTELKYAWINSNPDQDFPGGIINFTPTPESPLKDLQSISKVFSKHKIAHSIRLPGVRISPHAFNRDEEIERALYLLDFERK